MWGAWGVPGFVGDCSHRLSKQQSVATWLWGSATAGYGAQLALGGVSHASAVPGEAPGFSQEQHWETSQLLHGSCY